MGGDSDGEGGSHPRDYDFSLVGGLILDLQADMFEKVSAGGMVWMDSSGEENHLTEVEGRIPELVENCLDGQSVIRFLGESIVSSPVNIIEGRESYTIFSIARYCGEKRDRVISSKNNNWLFGFHNGNVDSLFAGSWLSEGTNSATDEWHLHSAVMDTDDKDSFEFFNNGSIVCKGAFSEQNKYSSIGRLSIGAWRTPTESDSECEVARILIFNRALSERSRRHVEILLGIQYSINGASPQLFVEWAQDLGDSLSGNPEISYIAALIALTELRDPEVALSLLNHCDYADADTHSLKAGLYESMGQEDEALSCLYTGYFLNPNEKGAIRRLLDKKKEIRKTIELIDYLQLVNSQSISGEIIDVEGDMKNYQLNGKGISNDPLFFKFKECEDLLLSGKYSLFFEQINNSLREEVNNYSALISNRLKGLSRESEIRDLMVERLNHNSENNLVIRYSTEFFKHLKRKTIGGFADRVKGATTAMLLSIATGRRFEIDWKHPFELDEAIIPLDYDWRVEDSDIDAKGLVLIDGNFTQLQKDSFKSENIEKILDIEGASAELYCNIFHPGSLENPSLKGELDEYSDYFNQPHLVGSLLSMFEYRPNIIESAIVTNFLQYLDMFDDSIAVHFRTGGDGDWEDASLDSEDNVTLSFQRAREIIGESGKSTCVFFATDSAALKKKVMNEYGSELHVFTINIPLTHMDRSLGSNQIIGSRFAIMENYMISMCNHILAGKGAFSVISANRRFEWPWRYFKTH